ncbi:hypothetical protein [Vibrio phage phiKT1024]|nr:hypothetical protein [Vibrio phage phiKT1024]
MNDKFARMLIEYESIKWRGLYHYSLEYISQGSNYHDIIWSTWEQGTRLLRDNKFTIIMESDNYKVFANIREDMPELFI